ncbi:MAG TPA: glycosyltransferase family 4 protein [Ktedonobacteraceae bacterium]|nr:glycosyltransferase family 4 protein [Ktedonobacteraceae bacterium]
MQEHQRICFISFYFSPMVGGAETQSERQARQLQALGNEVIVVTLRADRRWKRREMLDGLPVVRIGGIYKRNGQLRVGRLGYLPCDIGMFLTLWQLRHKYDVIHVFQMSPLAAAAALIGKIAHKPVVISIQSTGPNEEQCKRLEHGARLMVDTITGVDTNFLNLEAQDVVTGDFTHLPRVALGGNIIINFLRKSKACFHVNSTRNYAYTTSNEFRAGQIVCIPHGVDTEKYRPATSLGVEHRNGLAKQERTILCVARLDYAKGIDVLLHAWARLMKARSALGAINRATATAGLAPTPRLHLVGDGSLRPQLERMVSELDISDSVEFMGMRKDIPELLQQAWGFVCPSRWESLPNALLEAMACGLPCVATRVSGTEDIMIDGKNGLMVEPEEPVEMALALQRIIEDSNLAQQLGKMARATIIPDYQLTTVVKRFTELYRYLITHHKHGENWTEGQVPWRPQGPPLGHYRQGMLQGEQR